MVSALISVKDKLCTLLNKGADIVLSAENPPKWIIEELGSPPSIYSIEVNSWVLKAARVVLGKHAPNFTYVATTDYVEHKYDPSTHESKLHMELVDEEIGNIVEETNNLLLCIGADHGMGNKTKAVNLKSALGRAKVDSWVIPTVKDRYVPHHSNLSGSAYIYLSDKKQANKASSILYELEGVEHILTADCAATKYHLPNYKVGDFFILGDEETVFGEVSEDVVSDVGMRSHGSLHEKNVPIIVYNCYTDNIKIKENKDMIKIIMDWLI
jgi:phosphonoacetate hydrolase